MKRDELIALIKEQIKSTMDNSEFTVIMKAAMEDMLKNLQNDVQVPFSKIAQNKISTLSGVKIDGDYMTTAKGSIINMKSKFQPWVSPADEVAQWAKDFIGYVKTRSVSKLLSTLVDSSGGFFVPDDFRALLLMYDYSETAVWQRATVWPMTGQKMAFPKLLQNADVTDADFDHFAGVSFSWTEEGDDKPETQPEFGLVELLVHELSGYTELTNTLIDDSVINLLNYLTRIFRNAWYWITDKQFLVGTGGKRPLGVIYDPGVLVETRKTASNVNVEDVLNMDARLPSVFDQNAVWVASKKVVANLRGQKTTGGELILREMYNDISSPNSKTLLGRPVVLADGKIPALGSFGDLILGDFSQYYVGFREDFSMDSSVDYQFRKAKTALRCLGRVDGVPANPQAFVVLSNATS